MGLLLEHWLNQDQEKRMSGLAAIFLLFLFSNSSLAQNEAASTNKRNGRLFFVSSSSTTSTVSTPTLCWSSNTAAAISTCGRKRRAITDKMDNPGILNPAPVAVDEKDSYYNVEEDDVMSSKTTPSEVRDPRFLL